MASVWDCEKCGYNHYEQASNCKHCGTESNLPDMVNHPPHYKDSVDVECPACWQLVDADCIDKEDRRCRSCIEAEAKQGRKDDVPKAVKILNEAVQVMAERGKSYDKSGGEAERSMPKIVAMFNALTGHELTPEQGWKFMCCLKLARSEQGEYREDNYLDGAAYMALAGEEASEANDD